MEKRSIIPGILILLLFVLHLHHARQLFHNDDNSALQPIVSQSSRTRICAELCLSGLGGTPCGDRCYDLMPSNLPISQQQQQQQDAHSSNENYNFTLLSRHINSGGTFRYYNVTTKQNVCDILCQNGLGYPLCNCKYDTFNRYDIDFLQVCAAFCVNYDYQVYGCQSCSLYKNISTSANNETDSIISGYNSNTFPSYSSSSKSILTIEWNTWCMDVCSDGNGGAACNCDLLP